MARGVARVDGGHRQRAGEPRTARVLGSLPVLLPVGAAVTVFGTYRTLRVDTSVGAWLESGREGVRAYRPCTMRSKRPHRRRADAPLSGAALDIVAVCVCGSAGSLGRFRCCARGARKPWHCTSS